MNQNTVRGSLPPEVKEAGVYLLTKAFYASHDSKVEVAIELARAAATVLWADSFLWREASGLLDRLLEHRGGQE